jgi:hypothetical protein
MTILELSICYCNVDEAGALARFYKRPLLHKYTSVLA